MAEQFAGMGIAIVVVTASIILAGILIGVGRAFNYKRIEYFGIEELIQSVINAAIIGSFAALTGVVASVSSSVVSVSCTTGTVIEQLICTLDLTNIAIFSLLQELLRVLTLIGYYQQLSLDFGTFTILPFGSLSALSGALSGQLLSLNALMILIGLNTQVAIFIKQSVLSMLFPVGLVLRTFFATRKVGGFLIALGLGLFIFYPTFILIFPSPQADINTSISSMKAFTNNSFYAPVPVVDLNSNYAIAGKLDVMSGRCKPSISAISNVSNMTDNTTGNATSNVTSIVNASACASLIQSMNFSGNTTPDFSSDVTKVTQASSQAISKSLLYAVVAPLFSLIITIVFVRELGSLLGSEIGLKTMASI